MRVLVYGAGVIGSVYAARLHRSGHHVTVLARGGRLTDIVRHGIVLEDVVSGSRSTTNIKTIEKLEPGDSFDIALITVRRDQLSSVMPELRAIHRIPTLLYMLNNPNGSEELAQAPGSQRVVLGFPGIGGWRDGHVVRYAAVPQPTMLGEFSGRRTVRVRQLARMFRSAGFRVRISPEMDAWLKAHAFFVTAVSGAIYVAGGDSRRLSVDAGTLRLMCRGVREGFAAIRTMGLPVRPWSLNLLFKWLPLRFAVSYWRRFFARDIADTIFGRRVLTASDEMHELANDCRALLQQYRIKAPALRRLFRAVDAYAEEQDDYRVAHA